MNIRKVSLAIVTVAALSPAISNASNEQTALNACAKAFATSIASPGASAPAFKLDYRGDSLTGSIADVFARDYTFQLKATDPKTGAPVARATCSADLRGTVLSLEPTPVNAAAATLAARL